MADTKHKMAGFSAAAQDICDAIESILNQPDDPTVKDGFGDTYDDEGLQTVHGGGGVAGDSTLETTRRQRDARGILRTQAFFGGMPLPAPSP